ncbi:glutathione gamma-glutamylcysteinyltransferase 3-like [Cucumis melo var. makuwa]|uniref:glutathione gamma-glutamylcysteinyltransferase n=1 Tax=Cucumis melo var. makuwa TaxID=1194695 RepID=A0A5A7V401_CUCMM|nr:glutathione gamma-glutamylcysteinyltransferase 3-like [Cucumis melo var. makuwa]
METLFQRILSASKKNPSTPIPNPWKPYFKESSLDLHKFPKSRLAAPSSKLLPAPSMIGCQGIKMMGTGKRIPRMAVLDRGLCCGIGSWDGDTKVDMARVDHGTDNGFGGNPFSPQSHPTSPPGFYRRVLPSPPAVDFASFDGKRLFTEALRDGTMEGFFKLIPYHRTQSEITYCGLTSLAVVLNALSVDCGRKGWIDETMLDCCEPLTNIKTDGITFGKLAYLACCNGAKVVACRTNESTVDDFRKHVISCSSSQDRHMITTFHRRVLKQTGAGHISPIGGYHAGKDMVLILDVARFKYPPHWVPLILLWDAMNTIDDETGLHRGYMILSKLTRGPSILYSLSCQHEGWNNVIKYLTEQVPLLLKTENVKSVDELLSVVFKLPLQNLKNFIKWVAEVREREDGNLKLNAVEKGKLSLKEETLEQLRATELIKHIKQLLASGTLCEGFESLFDKDALSDEIAATVSCQGAETLAVKPCSADRRCQWPSVIDVLTILLLSLPQHIWFNLKDEKLLADINRLVGENYLPALLQDEVLHLREQMQFLMIDLIS